MVISIKETNSIPEVYEQYDRIAQWFDQSRTKDLMEREYLEYVLKYLPNQGTILDLVQFGLLNTQIIHNFHGYRNLMIHPLDHRVSFI